MADSRGCFFERRLKSGAWAALQAPTSGHKCMAFCCCLPRNMTSGKWSCWVLNRHPCRMLGMAAGPQRFKLLPGGQGQD